MRTNTDRATRVFLICFRSGGAFRYRAGTVKWFNDASEYASIVPGGAGGDLYVRGGNFVADLGTTPTVGDGVVSPGGASSGPEKGYAPGDDPLGAELYRIEPRVKGGVRPDGLTRSS
jgi:cold shock CspA family protein